MMGLVTGGSGSGKSARAEEMICRLHHEDEHVPLYYIATMVPWGSETRQKIERHRKMRAGKGFQTVEWYTGIAEKLQEDKLIMRDSCVLLECMSNLTANELYMDNGAKEQTVSAVEKGIRLLRERCRHLVVVTNEVFSETGPDSTEMDLYKNNLGKINRILGKTADEVTEVVYGIPLPIRKSPEERKAERRHMRGMHVITGGAYQGKTAWAKQCCPDIVWADGETCDLDHFRDWTGIIHFHCLIRRWMEAGRKRDTLLRAVLTESGIRVIVSDEIGYGLVPVDAFEREYRESVGRVMTELAHCAERVDRIVCGIPVRLK